MKYHDYSHRAALSGGWSSFRGCEMPESRIDAIHLPLFQRKCDCVWGCVKYRFLTFFRRRGCVRLAFYLFRRFSVIRNTDGNMSPPVPDVGNIEIIFPHFCNSGGTNSKSDKKIRGFDRRRNK